MRKISLKKLYTIRVQLYDILEKTNNRKRKKEQWLPGVWVKSDEQVKCRKFSEW